MEARVDRAFASSAGPSRPGARMRPVATMWAFASSPGGRARRGPAMGPPAPKKTGTGEGT